MKWKTCLRKEKTTIQPQLLLAAIWFTPKCFNTGGSRQSGCFLFADFKYLQSLGAEESRGVHNHLMLDVPLKLIQTSQLWKLLRFFQIWLVNSHCSMQWLNRAIGAGDSSLIISHGLAFNLVQSKPGLYCMLTHWHDLMTFLLLLLLFQLSLGCCQASRENSRGPGQFINVGPLHITSKSRQCKCAGLSCEFCWYVGFEGLPWELNLLRLNLSLSSISQ